MNARQRSRVAPASSHLRTRCFLLAAVAAVTIVSAGCGPGTPAAPVTRRIMILDELDTGACEHDCSFTFFLGSQTLSFNFLLEISGLTDGASVTVSPPSGQGAITFAQDESLGTGTLTGNVAVFRVRWSGEARPTVGLSDVVVTQNPRPFIVPRADPAPLADTVPYMPTHLNAPVYLIQDHDRSTRYFLSVDGLPAAAADHKVAVILDRTGQTVVSEAATGFALPEWSGAWDRLDSDAVNQAKILPIPTGANRLLFSVTLPSGKGSGIARFEVSDRMETQTLDYERARQAGAGFYNNRTDPGGSLPYLLPSFCVAGQDSTAAAPGLTVNDALEGMAPDQQGVVFGVGCHVGVRATPEAYKYFELKNGWTISALTSRFSTCGYDWYDSEDEAEQDARRHGLGAGDLGDCTLKGGCTNNYADRQGVRLLEQPPIGSASPYLRASVWMDAPKLPDKARALWVTVRMTIEGPAGTDPYGNTATPSNRPSPCREGYFPLDSPEGPACARIDESDSMSDSGFAQDPILDAEFRCDHASDCGEGYICANAHGYADICVIGYLRQ